MQLPGPVRAVVGLVATAADEARHLPERAIELPMLAVSSALQMSLRAQQRYARLAARGDDVINRRPANEEPPSWATFDDPVPGDDLGATTLGDSDLRARAASQLLDELLSPTEPAAADDPPSKKSAPTGNPEAPARKPAAKRTVAKTTAQAPTTKASVEKALVKSTPAAKKAISKAPAKKSPAKKAGKTISKPRHTSPSPFDTVDDE
jgi:hypothetical protein